MLNFNEIFDSVIAGLICSATIGSISFAYKFVRKKYEEDDFTFFLNLSFYINLFSLILSCLQFDINVLFANFFSFDNVFNFFFLICIIINLRGILTIYKNTKNYINYCKNNSAKK